MRVPIPAVSRGLPVDLAKQKPKYMPFNGVHTGQLHTASRAVEKGEDLKGKKNSHHPNTKMISIIIDFQNHPFQTR